MLSFRGTYRCEIKKKRDKINLQFAIHTHFLKKDKNIIQYFHVKY